MEQNSNLAIYQKYLELIYYSNTIVRKYPKSEQFALVKEIKSTLYTGLRFLMYAIKSYSKMAGLVCQRLSTEYRRKLHSQIF